MKYLAVICRTLIWSKAPQKTLQKHYFALAGIELSRLDSRVLVQSLSNKRTFGRKKNLVITLCFACQLAHIFFGKCYLQALLCDAILAIHDDS